MKYSLVTSIICSVIMSIILYFVLMHQVELTVYKTLDEFFETHTVYQVVSNENSEM